MVNNIINIYFNITNISTEKRRKNTINKNNKRYFSTDKILVGKPEIKHNNDKVIINIYTFNRKKLFFFKKLYRLYISFFSFSSELVKIIFRGRRLSLSNDIISFLDKNKLLKKKRSLKILHIRKSNIRNNKITKNYLSNKHKLEKKILDKKIFKKFQEMSKRNNLEISYKLFKDYKKRYYIRLEKKNIKNLEWELKKPQIELKKSLKIKYNRIRKLTGLVKKSSKLRKPRYWRPRHWKWGRTRYILEKKYKKSKKKIKNILKKEKRKKNLFSNAGINLIIKLTEKKRFTKLMLKRRKSIFFLTKKQKENIRRKRLGVKQKKNYKKLFRLFFILKTDLYTNNRNKNLLKKILFVSKRDLLFKKSLNKTIKSYLKENQIEENIPYYLKIANVNNIIEKYYSEFASNCLKKEILFFKYNQFFVYDHYKFNYTFLSKLGVIISNIYKNKKIEFNIINLKYAYLDSNIFTRIIARKLQNRELKSRTIIRKALNTTGVLTNKINIYTKNLLYYSRYLNLNKKKLSNIINKNKDQLNIILKRLLKNNSKDINIFRDLRYKLLGGIRLKTQGRLTYKLTASRSVKNIKSIGSTINLELYHGLKNNYRGNYKPNIDYTNINSTTNNGSFGLKGWINSK